MKGSAKYYQRYSTVVSCLAPLDLLRLQYPIVTASSLRADSRPDSSPILTASSICNAGLDFKIIQHLNNMKSLAFLFVALIGVTAAFFRPAVPFQIENLGHIAGQGGGYNVDTKDFGLDNPGMLRFFDTDQVSVWFWGCVGCL